MACTTTPASRRLIQLIRLIPFCGRGLPVVAALILAGAPDADALENDCVAEPALLQTLTQTATKIKSKQIDFVAGGRSFHIKIDHSYLNLIDHRQTVLSRVPATQYEYGGLSDLALMKNGWLWIDGDETDYVAHVDFTKMPPAISQPVKLSELTQSPSSKKQVFFQEYVPAQGVYSASLDRVFVTGHRTTFLGGPDPVALEFVDGQITSLPPQLNEAEFLADIEKPKGVIFRGRHQEALFYDGVRVTSLLNGHVARQADGNYGSWIVHQQPRLGKTFLSNMLLPTADKKFLLEIKPGPTLAEVVAPGRLCSTRLNQENPVFTK